MCNPIGNHGEHQRRPATPEKKQNEEETERIRRRPGARS
jgi:hypothetical protein